MSFPISFNHTVRKILFGHYLNCVTEKNSFKKENNKNMAQ